MAKRTPYREAVIAFQRSYWEEILKRTDHCISAAARLSGAKRSQVYKTLTRLGIHIPRHAQHRGNWGD